MYRGLDHNKADITGTERLLRTTEISTLKATAELRYRVSTQRSYRMCRIFSDRGDRVDGNRISM